jgi:dTDP-4-amino-4,6-dideoxygalactose transaminase
MSHPTPSDLLALEGGAPLSQPADWPRWPEYGPDTLRQLFAVLESRRWSISGAWTGRITREQEFAERWAAWNGAGFAVPTANGTSSLVIALEALDVGAGDEVIVPALTWVAPATAAMEVNARPVIVDVDPRTACMDVDAVRAAITPHTRAVIAVHLYGSMVDVGPLAALCRAHGLALIEDCAQSHGSRYAGKNAGTWGDVGVFSMHQGKVLTSGEGGAAITDDPHLYRRMQQLRADGRIYLERTPAQGETQLEEVGEVQGANRTMSDFAAALLLDGLTRLEQQNRTRERNARRLDAMLREIPGVTPQARPALVEQQTYYHYLACCAPEAFAGRSGAAIARALDAELGTWVHPPYPPLPAHPLYRPRSKRRFRIDDQHWAALDPSRFELPRATELHARAVVFHHAALLAEPAQIERIAQAFAKVQRLAHRIPEEARR